MVLNIQNKMKSNCNDLAVLALGSNLPGSFESVECLLEAALKYLSEIGFNLFDQSSWWRSASWPDPTKPDYLNGVVFVEPAVAPDIMLQRLRQVEAKFGRARSKINAPRTLDLDLIAHGRLILDSPDLIVPHPRASERLFVMGPLAQVAPDWIHPVLGETASELAKKATVGRDAHLV